MDSLKYIKNLGGCCLLFLVLCSASYRILPVVSINGVTKGYVDAIEFSQYKMLNVHSNRSNDCNIEFYTMYHISLTKDVTILKGTTCGFSDSIQQEIHQAEKGDKYIFINVKVRCEGDKKAVNVNALNFNIK